MENTPPTPAAPVNHTGLQDSFDPPFLPIDDSTPPQSAASTDTPAVWRFRFFGQGMEYFKIWIVNWLLILVTLGLYSPWAKVRRLRYFYGHTELNDRRFDFVANPKRILLGRLIAIAIYAFFMISGQYSPELSAVGGLLIIALVPWLIRSSLRFFARNSKYGNTRFSFQGSLAETYGLMISNFFLGLISFGLLMPAMWWGFKRYQFNNTHFGQLKFSFNASIGQVYKAILLPIVLLIVLALAFFVLVGSGFAATVTTEGAEPASILFLAIGALGYLLIYMAIFPLIQGYLFKVTWQNMTLGVNHFTTNISPFQFAWMTIVNTLALIPSFGLLWAWGRVRITRYQLESLSLIVHHFPDNLQNPVDSDASPLGEEISDVFDIDISW